ncbi:hypothetical protein [Neptuniibacter sp. UBA6509]|uniref:hypothetical protein n=2 Tax=unclassified Neptuniibacter TaxID=2630693 RepID=UPI0025D1993D|nr:hypothetical protein [Neptuniibacter sp. UBA6509]
MSAAYMNFATSRQAQNETRTLGNTLAKQSDILIRPLLLSNDRVSLNFLLNELKNLSYISGLQIQNNSGIIIARAGNISDLKLQKRLLQQDRNLATVTLWLNPAPIESMLRSQLWPLAIIALASIILALSALWLFGYRSSEDEDEDEETEQSITSDLSFSETLAIQTDIVETEETEAADNSLPSATTSNTPEFRRTEQLDSAQHKATDSMGSHTQRDVQEKAPTLDQAAPQVDQLQTESLVDLLKPEQSLATKMPKFEHQPQDLEPDDKETNSDDFAVEEGLVTNAPPPPTQENAPLSQNPLLKQRDEREEVQLGLYSFEDELELILAPQDAIYLFYIDSNTASSDNMPPDEKATLLNVYLYLAKQVARIYHGEAEQLDNHDILLRFELRDSDDNHGTNALCAAMLFSLLYKGFNQARIKGFQPVLSLQMSVSRGHHDKYALVKEEAHFLTRTTHSNELISHTALTEAPKLKQALLKEAEIRREDEDKVLLLKITPNHQALLQKQANHLLTKIFKK